MLPWVWTQSTFWWPVYLSLFFLFSLSYIEKGWSNKLLLYFSSSTCRTKTCSLIEQFGSIYMLRHSIALARPEVFLGVLQNWHCEKNIQLRTFWNSCSPNSHCNYIDCRMGVYAAYSGRLLSIWDHFTVTHIYGLGTRNILCAKLSLKIYLLNLFVFFKTGFS